MCIADRVPFDAVVANELAEQYTDRYGGFVVNPNYAPVLDRSARMDSIRRCLIAFLAKRAAELALIKPRLAEHENRAVAVRRGLPMQQARAVHVEEDEYGFAPTDGRHRYFL
jgi:hypothetical protein